VAVAVVAAAVGAPWASPSVTADVTAVAVIPAAAVPVEDDDLLAAFIVEDEAPP
jgi:hypothetical protein